MKKLIAITFFVCQYVIVYTQNSESLTVEKIMSDSVYLGEVPDNLEWNEDSKTLYFNWRPMDKKQSSAYKLSIDNLNPLPIAPSNQDFKKRSHSYSKDFKKILFERDGDIFIKNLPYGEEKILVGTTEKESNPVFNRDESSVYFERGQNLYSISILRLGLKQLTNFTYDESNKDDKLSEQDRWLEQDQLDIFDVLKNQNTPAKTKEFPRKVTLQNSSTITYLSPEPLGRFIVFTIASQPEKSRNIIVPNYVTGSGYTEDISGRTKVGSFVPTFSTKIYDIKRDTIYDILTNSIPEIKNVPKYLDEYPEQLEKLRNENNDREVYVGEPIWSTDGQPLAVVNIASSDNKDRWIMKLDLLSGKLSSLDHQHDEAWIGGPGVGGRYRAPELGFLDDKTIYFQSEETGYSHLYSLNINNGQKKQLTSGNYEIQTLQLSKDKKYFYFTANKEHPGITHFYKMPIEGGKMIRLTSMEGGNEVTMSPDEKWLAIRHSTTTEPWELFLQENKPGATANQITKTPSSDFEAYQWKIPETRTFKNRYGKDIYAQVYSPVQPLPNKPAIIFVHSNGYLQNVHYWWSYHFREYMFNNLLVDKGFTVINIDYTASSGYGRDIRTGIYRYMGGKDLSDITDGAKLLVEEYGINPDNIGLYGGSYGGFLTLMALFTEPDVFKSGAALRSVTDWAHYNQGYTSNILNEPLTDIKAYKRSSPIYFADGLKGNLLMTHGIVDVNVNFQDIVRLTQRLIELGKDNWELAVYPLEDHNFIYPPSWTDQYKRILKLFEETLTD
ncbi:Dipeptidyl aminopeptidase/acylaminoacyl peptidase [Flavobacteriaceae bacterium MAR_2010_188]|nr:Dipeptidyl aminopeptidase/acylaminoacyl peptidase [Flavobacteriaceae bacterium MAR_2010_188]